MDAANVIGACVAWLWLASTAVVAVGALWYHLTDTDEAEWYP